MVSTRAKKEVVSEQNQPEHEEPAQAAEQIIVDPTPPVATTDTTTTTAKTEDGSATEAPPKKKAKTVATFSKGLGAKIELASVSKLSPAERLALRTSKFKTTVSSSAKLTLRAKKFGGILPEAKQTFGPAVAAVDSEILKKRAERFAQSIKTK